MLELYNNIKNERIKNGWNQSELAKRVGYSDKSMIAKIEAGKVDLPQTKIRMFAEVFNCTESHLMGWDETLNESEYANDMNISESDINILKAFNDLSEESKRQLVLMLAFLKDQENKK